jgi:hypothetical protein
MLDVLAASVCFERQDIMSSIHRLGWHDPNSKKFAISNYPDGRNNRPNGRAIGRKDGTIYQANFKRFV